MQEGCDKFCTFCVVPYTRGAEYSRPVADIEAEARHLVDNGARELTLLGQNVNAYHGLGPDGAGWNLAQLLRATWRVIDGIERLRYTTSHPGDMGDDLIAAIGDVAKLMPHLHLPFQSGSDRILAAMNRKHTVADYLAVSGACAPRVPTSALSTDIIVGFPGETEQTSPPRSHSLKGGLRASLFASSTARVPARLQARLARIRCQKRKKTQRLQRQQSALGMSTNIVQFGLCRQVMSVLFERAGQRPGQIVGRSPYLQSVHAQGPADMSGASLDVEILAAGPNSLSGLILDPGRGRHDALIPRHVLSWRAEILCSSDFH